MNFEKFLVVVTGITGVIWVINKLFRKKVVNPIVIQGEENNFVDLIEYIGSFFIIFLAVLLFRTFLFEGYRIPSGSMKPTLVEGDFVLVAKYPYGLRLPITHKKILPVSEVKRGDVIIFWQQKSNKILIKRVVGLPGDHVLYKNQNLYINNELVKTENLGLTEDGYTLLHRKKELLVEKKHDIYVNPDDDRRYPFEDLVVGQNSYFVLGDNRNNSADSRFEGLISDDDVLGKAIFIYFSFNWDNKVLRFDRMWKKIK
jgi:signal peptidase I